MQSLATRLTTVSIMVSSSCNIIVPIPHIRLTIPGGRTAHVYGLLGHIVRAKSTHHGIQLSNVARVHLGSVWAPAWWGPCRISRDLCDVDVHTGLGTQGIIGVTHASDLH